MEQLYNYLPRELVTFILVTLFSLLIGLSQRRISHNYHHVKPRWLRVYNGSNTISNQGYYNSSNPENMKLRLLDVIVQPEQYPQNQTAPHKETHICFIKNIKQISQYTDKSKSTVCTEKRIPNRLRSMWLPCCWL